MEEEAGVGEGGDDEIEGLEERILCGVVGGGGGCGGGSVDP